MITQKMAAYMARNGGPRLDVPVNLELSYDQKDPLMIGALFTGDPVEDDSQVWVFARELILRGSQSFVAFGEGDVKFQRMAEDRNAVVMCLNNPTGHAHVWLPYDQLTAFLEQTTEAVPFGHEDIEGAIDEALKELLG